MVIEPNTRKETPMAIIKREKRDSVVEKKDKGMEPKKLRTLTVRSGVTAGLRMAGCNPCHQPNHNETLVTR